MACMMLTVVSAKNVAGESLKTNSDEVLVGPSLAIPFSESFAQAEYANTPWTTKTLAGKSYNGRWALRPDADHNNDGAGADFQGYEENSCSRLQSPKIDISNRHQHCQETGSYFLCKHSHWWSCSDSGSQR